MTNGTLMQNEFSAADLVRIVRERKWSLVAWTLILAVAALAWMSLTPPQYTATATLLVDTKGKALPEGLVGMPAGEERLLLDHVAALSSTSLVAEVIDTLDLDLDPEIRPEQATPGFPLTQVERSALIRNFQGNLNVSSAEESNVLRVSYQSTDPEKAALIANTVADTYLAVQARYDAEQSAQLTEWLTNRTERLQNTIVDLELKLVALRQTSELPVVENALQEREEQALAEQLLALAGEKADVTAKLDLLRRVGSASGSVAAELGESVNASVLVRLGERKAEIQKRIAELSVNYGPKHPIMEAAIAQRSQIASQLRQEASNVTRSLSNRLRIIESREAELRSQVNVAISRSSGNYIDNIAFERFERELTAKKDRLESLLTLQDTFAQQQGLEQQSQSARVIAPAMVPHKSSSPSRIGLFGIALFAGLLIGTLWAFVRELTDSRVRSARQLVALTGKTPLGELPEFRGDSAPAALADRPDDPFAIAVRNAHWNLSIQNQARLPASIVVTSAAKGEGKTTFACALARSIALSGHRVLLIDVNFRDGQAGEMLGIVSKPEGLSSLFSGKFKFYEVLVHDQSSGLHLLGPGPQPKNAAQLIAHTNMDSVLRFAQRKYDTVILDTPALNAGPEALLLARRVQSTLLMVNAPVSRSARVLDAVRRIEAVADRPVSVVLNQPVEFGTSVFVDPDANADSGDSRANVVSVTLPEAPAPRPEPAAAEKTGAGVMDDPELGEKSRKIIEAIIKIAENSEAQRKSGNRGAGG